MMKYILLIALFTLLIAPPALAEDDANPTIAILRFGPLEAFATIELAILDVLQSYGYVSEDERLILAERRDLTGERINILWGDANFDAGMMPLIIDNMLDQDVDVLVPITAVGTQTAKGIFDDLDNPPKLIFGSQSSPYESGMASSPCIKPDYLVGTEMPTSYEFIVPTLRLQNPEIKTVGVIHSFASWSAVYGAEQIGAVSESLGISVEVATVSDFPDLRLAAQGLISKGVEAFIIPLDPVTGGGLQIISTIAGENNIPLFHASVGAVFTGATVGAGSYHYYEHGLNIARLLVGHLNGDIDTATTAIHLYDDPGIGVNLDIAKQQGVDISAELLAAADLVVRGEGVDLSPEWQTLAARQGVVLELDERLADDQAFLEALACTPERIAAEQAELDAKAVQAEG